MTLRVPKWFLYTLLPSLLLTTTTGCNGDIFLDGDVLPEQQTVTIDGDGGEATFEIPTDGLENVDIDVYGVTDGSLEFYNAAGERLTGLFTFTDVARMVFDNDLEYFELIRNGNRLTAKSVCLTAQGRGTIWRICLEYTYGSRFIDVEVRPGRPLKFEGVYYPDGLTVTSRSYVRTRLERFYNEGPIAQSLEVWPMLQETATIAVVSAGSNSWMQGRNERMQVPTFDNGEWRFFEKNITIGRKCTYYPPNQMTKVEVTVPPVSAVYIYTDVYYTEAKANGVLVYENEVLGRHIQEEFTVTSSYPERYEIRVEDAN